jgi:hypothetical protein
VRTYQTVGHALADETSSLARFVKQGETVAAKRERIIAEWMATGLTREQAWLKALSRGR